MFQSVTDRRLSRYFCLHAGKLDNSIVLFEVLAFLNSSYGDILFLTAKFSIKYRILNSADLL